jgi:nitrite reductase (NO-forming)
MAAVVVAGGFLAAAVLAALAAAAGAAVVSPWLPLHLALAGGASTAIAGVMPFFVAALAAGPPAGVRLRGGAVALVAVGAALVAVRGIAPGVTWAPVVGGSLYLAGIGAVALAVRASGRAGLMVRRPIVTLGYTLALANVAIGAIIGTLAAAGWLPVLERWAQLRPAHAWANVIGFVSLVIVATLLHFLPTVMGGRIVPRRSAALAVLGIALGTPIVVAGLALTSGPVAGAGAVLVVAGALATAVEAARVVRDRGRWTTDPGWHRFVSVGLLAGVAWFVVGVAAATALLIARGPNADGWSTALVGAPLAIGWVAQVLMGSWTHLVPSIGPGGPVEHARQRVVLGRAATGRLLALNGGVAMVAIAWPAGLGALATFGGALAAAAVATSVVLLAAALRAGR